LSAHGSRAYIASTPGAFGSACAALRHVGTLERRLSDGGGGAQFTLPLVVLDAREVQVWGELGAEAVDVRRVADALSALREQGVTLSSRSSDFLAVDDHNVRSPC
jgi:hypothetical protein